MLAKFIKETGGDQVIVERFAELGTALLDLERGTVHPVLRHNAAGGRTVDRDDIWSCRATVAIALDFLVESGMTPRKGAEQIESKYPQLERLCRRTNPSGPSKGGRYTKAIDLPGSILSWRRRLREKTVNSALAVTAYHTEGIPSLENAKKTASAAEIKAAGEHLLGRAVSDAMRLLPTDA